MATTTIKSFGFDMAQARLVAVTRFVQAAPRRIGDQLSGEVRKAIKHLPKKTTHGQWVQSVESAASGKTVEIFYNLAVAKYARMRERGGVIVPFRAKRLFIPLKPDVRPKQKGLIFGVDFVLAKKAVQTGSNIMENTIRKQLTDPNSAFRVSFGKDLEIAWAGGAK